MNSWVLLVPLIFQDIEIIFTHSFSYTNTYYEPEPTLSTMEIKIRHDDQNLIQVRHLCSIPKLENSTHFYRNTNDVTYYILGNCVQSIMLVILVTLNTDFGNP